MMSMRTRVLVNGWRGEDIWIGGGTPAGDPLAPLLYVLTIEPFLRKMRRTLKGIGPGELVVKGENTFKVGGFVDDVVFGVGDVQEVAKVKDGLREYERLAGARVNLLKCETLFIGGAAVRWMREEKAEWKIGVEVEDGKEVRYLGAYLTWYSGTIRKEWWMDWM